MRLALMNGATAMGTLCATVGALCGLLVVHNATGSGYESFVVAAPVSAFLSGAALWWLLITRKQRVGVSRGVVAGALAGALGHLVCWYLVIVSAYICNALTGGCTDSLGEPPMNPLYALGAAATYSAFSLLFVGWLTVPAGGLLGGLLAIARRRAARNQTPNPSLQRTTP